MGKFVLSKKAVFEIATKYYERDSDNEWLKRVHQMSHVTLRKKMKEYNIKTKIVVIE